MRLVQTEPLEHLALDDARQDRDAHQPVDLVLRQQPQHAGLNAVVDQGHAEESRRSRVLQRGLQFVHAFDEVDLRAEHHGRQFDGATFEGMRQRQIAQQALASPGWHGFDQTVRGEHHVAVADHHPFRMAGGAGGVDQRHQLIGFGLRHFGEWRVFLHQHTPFECLFRNAGIGHLHDANPRRNGLQEAVDVGHRAQEQHLRFAVLEDVADMLRRLVGVQANRDATGHRDRRIGHVPVRRVHAGDRDTGARRQIQCLEGRGHALRLVGDFAPGIAAPLSVDRLMQVRFVGTFLDPLHQQINRAVDAHKSVFLHHRFSRWPAS